MVVLPVSNPVLETAALVLPGLLDEAVVTVPCSALDPVDSKVETWDVAPADVSRPAGDGKADSPAQAAAAPNTAPETPQRRPNLAKRKAITKRYQESGETRIQRRLLREIAPAQRIFGLSKERSTSPLPLGEHIPREPNTATRLSPGAKTADTVGAP